MKKIFMFFSATMVLLSSLTPLIVFANENAKVIVAQGLFTDNQVKPAVKCAADSDFNEEYDGAYKKVDDDEAAGLFGDKDTAASKDKFDKIIGKFVGNILKKVINIFDVAKCESNSLLMEIVKVTSPVNVTNNPIIMQLMKITQLMALSLSIVIIGAFSIMYLMNFENLNVVKFGIRLSFSMGAVYFLPYLIQDILNINNMFVYYISNTSITGKLSGGIGVGFLVVAFEVMGALIAGAVASGGSLLIILGIAVLTLAVNLAMQLIRLILWWYTRMLTIYLLAVVGPFMVIFMALPQTADLAEKWLKKLIGEVFSQLIFTIALVFFLSIFMNIGVMRNAMDISMAGYIFMYFAALAFFVDLPRFSKELLDGGVKGNGLSESMAAAQKITSSVATGGERGIKNMADGYRKKLDEKRADNLTKGIFKGNGSGKSGGGAGNVGAAASISGNKNVASAAAAGAAAGAMAGKSGGSSGPAKAGDPTIGASGPSSQTANAQTKKQEEARKSNAEMKQKVSNIAMNASSRNQALGAIRNELAKDTNKYPEGAESFAAKSQAEKLLTDYEENRGMSFGAMKEMESLANQGGLNDGTFNEIMSKDIADNPDLHKNVDLSSADGKENYINNLKDDLGITKDLNQKAHDKSKEGFETSVGFGAGRESTNVKIDISDPQKGRGSGGRVDHKSLDKHSKERNGSINSLNKNENDGNKK